jgi:SEC-C motif-containing protein
MRSRYAAYAKGNVAYIISTTDPFGSQWRSDREAWTAEVEVFCAQTSFDGLVILETSGRIGNKATISFEAKLSRSGQDTSFAERSNFSHRDGRWFYVDGSPIQLR